jgi:hypothetical protein
VTDSSKAVVPNALVTATNIDTGVQRQVTTSDQGYYSFPGLAVGRYDISMEKSGFKRYQRKGVAIDASSSVVVDVSLEIGGQSQSVTVSESTVHVQTSDTQMGEVLSANKIEDVPLNGRSYTDLLALQPGVVPVTSLTSNSQQDVGVSPLSPSGGLNPGTLSINGQRDNANAFIVNGTDAEEDVNGGSAIIPNLDSIAEFRLLTSNFDAQLGGHSGGQIQVVTKSGTNAFHGDAFEFLRNTDLDARNFYSPSRGAFNQSQFGGTFGGPIRKTRAFFFADYQGTRLTEGIDTGAIPVPSIQDREGNLADLASSFTTTDASGNTVPTTVSGSYWASLLSQKFGYPVGAGEPYYTPGCSAATCVLPWAAVPPEIWSAPAQHLLQDIPLPNLGTDTFSTSSAQETLRDDKVADRMDFDTRGGQLFAYYFFDGYTLNNPYPTAQSGASVPGFSALYLGRAQMLTLGDTKTLGANALNEAHISFLRDANNLGKPIGGLGTSLASQGFVTGPGTPGIVPLAPQTEGVENLVFNAFSTGAAANQLQQVNNTFQLMDNFSKVAGHHTVRFGIEMHADQINTNPRAQFNGSFLFTGSETGIDFADFLLGIPSQYNQSQLQTFYGRNRYWGLFGQDSWRLRSHLTLNYGLRWDRNAPWYEKNNGISTFEAGKQSLVFPGAPPGILFPTDPGVPRTLSPPGNLDFAPRFGAAYSPSAKGNTLLGKILGGTGQTSIRAGFGVYYAAIEALTIGIDAGNAPFGITYSSPASPLFSTPFITASTGQDVGQVFPVALSTQKASASHPNSSIDWAQFEPISGIPGYGASNSIPYTDEYMLSLQRQLGPNTLLSVSYTGAEGHHLLAMLEANPGNPALCLSLSQTSEVAPNSPTCGPFLEGNVFTSASGQVINGTRGPLGFNFGSDTLQSAIGKSDYNALQISLRHVSGPLEVFAGYTFGKSMDDSSDLGEEVYPFNPALSYALSSFDIRHNFVASYKYKLPIERLLRRSNRLTQGWEFSAITHFATGFPVTMVNYGDNSLLGAEPNGINNYGVDEPDFTVGPLHLNHNPRNGKPYFDISLFSENALGSPGTSARRFFYGPGLDNFDLALLKRVRLTETKSLQFRFEGFNAFNHTQFFGPDTVETDITNPLFGYMLSADPPRLVQASVKFFF